jgi:methylated-DNA-[protein]-cysteine S-methyltransferase
MNAPTRYRYALSTPLGPLTAVFEGSDLVALEFDRNDATTPGPFPPEVAASLQALGRELDAYFAGERVDFDVPLAPAGTPFQREVWTALRHIPWGTTASYAEVARRIGRPRAVRAVGAANARNPIAILVPCHRVIGADGSLTGYAGGLARKRALLELEGKGV